MPACNTRKRNSFVLKICINETEELCKRINDGVLMKADFDFRRRDHSQLYHEMGETGMR